MTTKSSDIVNSKCNEELLETESPTGSTKSQESADCSETSSSGSDDSDIEVIPESAFEQSEPDIHVPINSKLDAVSASVQTILDETTQQVNINRDIPSTAAVDGLPKAIAGAEPSTKAAGDSCSAAEALQSEQPVEMYHLKHIKFDGISVPIVMQNANGPCPLLALANVLLLRGKITLPEQMQMVSASQLLQFLGEVMLANMPQDIVEAERLNYEHNVSAAMDVLHKLQTGLDVNVRFSGVNEFEYTQGLIVFDLLNINLLHGWLIEENAEESRSVMGKAYNQLVEMIISQRSSEDEAKFQDALLAEQFLERSASQLTVHGLCELNSFLNHHQLAVFFRNNHFNTLYKHDNNLLQLVTDSGFLLEPSTVWEQLSNVEGDTLFLDSDFRPYRPSHASAHSGASLETAAVSQASATASQASATASQQSDFAMALQLEQEDREQAEIASRLQRGPVSDQELAQQLQAEEERRMKQHQGPARTGTRPAPAPPRKKKENSLCVVS